MKSFKEKIICRINIFYLPVPNAIDVPAIDKIADRNWLLQFILTLSDCLGMEECFVKGSRK